MYLHFINYIVIISRQEAVLFASWTRLVNICLFLLKKGFGTFEKVTKKGVSVLFLKKVTKKNFLVLFREKEPKSFLIALRSKTLRKSCCVATHNGFLAILTGGSKTYDLLLC